MRIAIVGAGISGLSTAFYLQRALDTIDEDYGSVTAYLEQGLDFGPEKQARVRALLCENTGEEV